MIPTLTLLAFTIVPLEQQAPEATASDDIDCSRSAVMQSIQALSGSINDYTSMVRSPSTTERDNLIRLVDACQPTLLTTGMNQCVENAYNYTTASRRRSNANSRGLGFEMSAEEYFAQAPIEAMSLPEPLRDGLPANFREVAAENGWQVLEYTSRTVPNPGPTRSMRRVLIMANENGFDKWIQFTVGNYGQEQVAEQLVDFIAMRDDPEDRDIYFNQFWRDSNGRNPQRRDLNTHGGHRGFDSCYSCHPNGMRNISPMPGSVSAEDVPTLNSFRERIAGYGKVDWNGAITPEAYGPPMGREEGCVRCHNGYEGAPELSRGALNYMISSGHIRHKISADFSMAAIDEMTPTERDFIENMRNVAQIHNLSDEEKEQLERAVYTAGRWNDSTRYATQIDWLEQNGKISETVANGYREVLNGSTDFPDCRGLRPNCYKGLVNIASETESTIFNRDRYLAEFKEWLVEDCSVPEDLNTVPASVNNSEQDEPAQIPASGGSTSSSGEQQ